MHTCGVCVCVYVCMCVRSFWLKLAWASLFLFGQLLPTLQVGVVIYCYKLPVLLFLLLFRLPSLIFIFIIIVIITIIFIFTIITIVITIITIIISMAA